MTLNPKVQQIISNKAIKTYSSKEIEKVSRLSKTMITDIANANFEAIETRLIKTHLNSKSTEKSQVALTLLTKFRNWRSESNQTTSEGAQAMGEDT